MRVLDFLRSFTCMKPKIRLVPGSPAIHNPNQNALISTIRRKSHSSSTPSLREVPPEEYQQFADALREFRPHSYQVEAMLRGHLQYDYLGLLRASLYAPAAAAHRHHLAIISPTCSTNERCMFTIYWNERHLSDDAVFQMLRSLPVGGWNQPIMIRQMPLHLRPNLDSIMLKLSDGDLRLFAAFPTHVYILTPEATSPVPELPDGYYFGSINSSYGREIHQRWPEASTETLDSFSKYLDKFPSEAVFFKSDPSSTPEHDRKGVERKDELVSYAVYKQSTDVGMTHTQVGHRRRGLAQAATLRLAHRLHRAGLPVTGLSEVWHEASNMFHVSMGFQRYTDVDFPFYFPKRFDFSTVSYASNFVNEHPEGMKKWEEYRNEK